MRFFILLSAIILMPSMAYADCANPTRKEGTLLYNKDYKVAQFCNGTNWIGMAGGSSSGSPTHIIPGSLIDWPIMIECPYIGNLKHVLILNQYEDPIGNNVIYTTNPNHTTQKVWVKFNSSTGAMTGQNVIHCPNLDITQQEVFNLGGGGGTDTLAALGCSTGQVVAWDGSNWACAAAGSDDLGNHTATTNIQLGTNYLSGDGGDEGVYVDADGNVGIGTMVPTAKLKIIGALSDSSATENILIINRHANQTNSGGFIGFNRWTASSPFGRIGFIKETTSNKSAFIVETGGDGTTTEKLRVTNTGNLIITGTPYKPGGGSWAATSDARLKDIGSDYTVGLDAITYLKPVRYHYKEDNVRNEPSDREFIGLIAQEVKPYFPEAVILGDDGYYSLENTNIIYGLINAVKELKVDNDDLRHEIETLQQGMVK